MDNKSPFFSIIVSTCNRPKLLKRCLNQISQQTFKDFDVIIINNGSNSDALALYKAMESEYDERFKFHDFNNISCAGFGPAYARNIGIELSCSNYVAFCDDDDEWVDTNYLRDVHSYLIENTAQLIVSNQLAITTEDSKEANPRAWFQNFDNDIEKCTSKIKQLVNTDYFVNSGTFPHLNISIYDATFLKGLKGFNKTLWYEEDLDLFLRALQKKPTIAINTGVVAHHYIPNKKSGNNITSGVNNEQKHHLRLIYLQQLIGQHGLKNISNYTRSLLSDTYKHLATHAALKKDYSTAKMYAYDAHCVKPTLKWFGYFLYLTLLSVMKVKND